MHCKTHVHGPPGQRSNSQSAGGAPHAREVGPRSEKRGTGGRQPPAGGRAAPWGGVARHAGKERHPRPLPRARRKRGKAGRGLPRHFAATGKLTQMVHAGEAAGKAAAAPEGEPASPPARQKTRQGPGQESGDGEWGGEQPRPPPHRSAGQRGPGRRGTPPTLYGQRPERALGANQTEQTTPGRRRAIG